MYLYNYLYMYTYLNMVYMYTNIIYIFIKYVITKQINAMTEEDSLLFSFLLYTIVKAQTKVRSMVN